MGEGKVFISTSGAVREGCDLTIILSLRMAAMFCEDQVLVCTPDRCENRGGPTLSQTNWSFVASSASPSPNPQNPCHILIALIYMIPPSLPTYLYLLYLARKSDVVGIEQNQPKDDTFWWPA